MRPTRLPRRSSSASADGLSVALGERLHRRARTDQVAVTVGAVDAMSDTGPAALFTTRCELINVWVRLNAIGVVLCDEITFWWKGCESLPMCWLDLVFGQQIGVLLLEFPHLRKTDHVHEVTEGIQRVRDRLALCQSLIDAGQGVTCSEQPDGGLDRRGEAHLLQLRRGQDRSDTTMQLVRQDGHVE